jgi:hypothetical protein
MYRGATASGIQIVTSGLLINYDAAQLRSYAQGGATTWTDLSGKSNNGTLTNGPSFNASNGGGIVFDGTNDYISVGTVSSNNLNLNGFSCCVWLNMSYALGSIPFFAICDASGNPIVPYFQFNNGGGTQKLEFAAKTAGGTFYQLFGTTSINFGTNVMVSATFNNTTTATAKIYINNNLENSATFFNGTMLNVNGQQMRLAFGTSGQVYFKGTIYSFQLYNRELTSTEISQNYSAVKTRFGL